MSYSIVTTFTNLQRDRSLNLSRPRLEEEDCPLGMVKLLKTVNMTKKFSRYKIAAASRHFPGDDPWLSHNQSAFLSRMLRQSGCFSGGNRRI